MIDFGDDAPAAAGIADFYQNSAQNAEQEGEPEERKVHLPLATPIYILHIVSCGFCVSDQGLQIATGPHFMPIHLKPRPHSVG